VAPTEFHGSPCRISRLIKHVIRLERASPMSERDFRALLVRRGFRASFGLGESDSGCSYRYLCREPARTAEYAFSQPGEFRSYNSHRLPRLACCH
jgi:hypothetical protein